MAVGVKLFSINKKTLDKTGQEQCLYRVCQDGLMYVIPFMRKRVYFCGKDLFLQLIKGVDVRHSDLQSEELRNILDNLSSGCVVMILLKNFNIINFSHNEIFDLDKESYLKFLRENYEDAICCYNSAVRLSSMINKEHQHVFNMKYDL
jgi:hypothetical protein